MVTSLKNSKYSTNCTCLLVSDCFCVLLLLNMGCSDTDRGCLKSSANEVGHTAVQLDILTLASL